MAEPATIAGHVLLDRVMMIHYGQVLLNLAGHPAPGLMWDDAHVAQGFAWSDGVAAFAVPDHDGEVRLRVVLADAGPVPDLVPDGVDWAVAVPFGVTGPLEVGTVMDLCDLDLPRDSYQLAFMARPGAGALAFVLDLVFYPAEHPGFRILRTGGLVTSAVVLRQSADPAV